MCDISLDSSLKSKYTLKISALYLSPSSRNRQNSICKSKRKIKLIHTNIKIKIHVSIPGLLYDTIGDMQNEKYFYDHYNVFVYNHDF